jgi:hypothetical protein
MRATIAMPSAVKMKRATSKIVQTTRSYRGLISGSLP